MSEAVVGMSLSFSDSFETDHLVAVKLRPKAREDGAREWGDHSV